MALPVLNVSLLSDIVTWAYADHEDRTDLLERFGPEWGSWSQGSWHKTNGDVCGSTYCIAGQTVAQVGYRLDLQVDEFNYNYDEGTRIPVRWGAQDCTPVVFDSLDDKGKPVYRDAGASESIADVARKALGLTYGEANRLFDGGNEIEDVIAYALCFAAGRNLSLNLSTDIKAIGEARTQTLAFGDFPGDSDEYLAPSERWDVDGDDTYNENIRAAGLWPDRPEPEPEILNFEVTYRVTVQAESQSEAESEAHSLVAYSPSNYHWDTDQETAW